MYSTGRLGPQQQARSAHRPHGVYKPVFLAPTVSFSEEQELALNTILFYTVDFSGYLTSRIVFISLSGSVADSFKSV